MNKTLMTVTVVMAMALGMTACKGKTSSEKASDYGQKIGTSVKDTTQDAGQTVKKAAEATGKAVGNAGEATGKAVGNAAEATGKAVGNAAEATGDFLTQSKDTAVKSAQEKVAALEAKWQALQDKAAPATDEAKADWQKAKDVMSQALADAKTKLAEAKDATVDVWQKDVKPAFDTALDKAQKLYDDAAAKFGG